MDSTAPPILGADGVDRGGPGALGAGSVFSYSLFLLWAELPYRPAPVPPEQWQGPWAAAR